jgi:hypothetical protein
MKTRFARLIPFVLTLCAVLGSTRPAAAEDCSAAIKQELASLCLSFSKSTLAPDVSKMPRGTRAASLACGGGGPERPVLFQQLTNAQKRTTTPPAQVGTIKVNPDYASWSPSSQDSLCQNLYVAVYGDTPSGPAGGDVSLGADEERTQGDAKRQKALHDAISTPGAGTPANARAALTAYRAKVAEYGGTTQTASGTSTSATSASDIAAETLQILGQIVVDRATAQAYALIKNKLLEWLQCQDDYSSKIGFNASCHVLGPLRLQDVAMSRDALLAALVADVTAKVAKDQAFDDEKALLGGLLSTTLIPLVTKPQVALNDSAVRHVLDALISYAAVSMPTSGLTPAQEVVAVGVTAYLQCLTPEQQGTDVSKVLAACDVGANVTKLAVGHEEVVPAALDLAEDLIFIATPTPKGGDLRPRLTRAADTVFSTSCMLVRASPPPAAAPGGAGAPPTKGAAGAPAQSTQNAAGNAAGIIVFPPPPTSPRLECAPPAGKTIMSLQDALDLLQPIVDDAINGNTNGLVASIVTALQFVTSTLSADDAQQADKGQKKALILLGSLLDYAATYTPGATAAGAATDANLHDQRTKILESLTTDMTDRTGRAGDLIFSLGGSLRLVGGARIGTSAHGAAFDGPVSLPLGFAVTQLAEANNRCHCGIHLEFDLVDLGQYLTWDDSAKVQTPKVEYAIAPSVTIGVAFGSSFPFVLGVTAGYAPAIPFDAADTSKKGTVNVGAVAGFHVPLLDLN